MKDTTRFKLVTNKELVAKGDIGENENIYVDIKTNKVYDEKGNELRGIILEQPMYQPETTVNYQQLGSENQILLGSEKISDDDYQNQNTSSSSSSQSDEEAYTGQISARLQGQINNLNTNSNIQNGRMERINQERVIIDNNYQASLQNGAYAQNNNPYASNAQAVIADALNRLNQPSSYGEFSYPVQFKNDTVGSYAETKVNEQKQANLAGINANVTLLPNHVLRQGTEWLVMVDNEVNTDKDTEVIGTILNGYYQGGKIYGVLTPIGTRRSGAMVQFAMIEPKNPRIPVVAMNAQARSLKDNGRDVATKVNRHYAQNYTAMIAESVLQGYGDAYSNRTTTTTITGSGTVVQNTPKVDSAEIRGNVYGALADRILADSNARLSNRPPTYLIKKGTVIKVKLTQNLDVRTGLAYTTGSDGKEPEKTTAEYRP